MFSRINVPEARSASAVRWKTQTDRSEWLIEPPPLIRYLTINWVSVFYVGCIEGVDFHWSDPEFPWNLKWLMTTSLRLCDQHSVLLNFKSPAVTLRTTRFKIKKIPHADYIALTCFVWISELAETFALHCINWLVFFITMVENVYSAVRIESLCNTDTIRL